MFHGLAKVTSVELMPPVQHADDVVDAAQQLGLDEVPVVIGNAEVDEGVTATEAVALMVSISAMRVTVHAAVTRS